MDQLDNLAANGGIHHYTIDTGLFLLQFHASGISDDHKVQLQAMRDQIGLMPSKQQSAAIARGALALLNAVRTFIPGPNYSAIFAHLNMGLQDASS